MDYGIFRTSDADLNNETKVFHIYEIGEGGLLKSTVRAQDKDGNLYDFQVEDQFRLAWANKEPELYKVLVDKGHYSKARIKYLADGTLPKIGETGAQSIPALLKSRGIKTIPFMVGMSTAASNRDAGSNVGYVWSQEHMGLMKDFDSSDENVINQMKANTPAITLGSPGTAGGISIGAAPGASTNFSSKSGQTTQSDSQTHSTQETSHGGGMMSTSLNLLQHFFIGLGNAVALPMPHMVNIVKMVAIGKFVKQVIGTKGYRVDIGNGQTKWQDGTGMYGLGDAINDVVPIPPKIRDKAQNIADQVKAAVPKI